jgi:formamidopyrimidine-DNA glycosylase
VRRRGKLLLVDLETPAHGPLTLLMHLMSAGRLQLFDKRGSLRDRTSRVLLRLPGDRELRLREFGTKQAAWVKLLRPEALEAEDVLLTLGPEAWPDPPELGELLASPRPLHSLLRDQQVIAGIGRTWVDEILWEARLSPFKKGSELSDAEVKALHDALPLLGNVVKHYEGVIGESIPDKMPMPLRVHRREGEPCPRCGTPIEAVFFAEHQMNYCPKEQTGGRVLKDRRLSRLLK